MLDIRHRGTLSGSVSYIYNIVPGLLDALGPERFVILHHDEQQLPASWPACEHVVVSAQSGAAQALFDQVALPGLIRRAGVDVYHPLKYLGSLRPPCRQVTTLHAITEPFEGHFPTRHVENLYWRLMGRGILKAGTHIIAVSEFIRRFLLARIGIPAERITVIPHGVDARFRRLPGTAAEGGRTDAPYLLTVGNIFPVKNFVMAVEVLAALSGEFPALRLKMAGATDHPYCAQLRQAAEAAGVAERIDFLGYLAPEALVPLMNGASCLLMPSLTEGCPVTLLEAMACGTPVVGSRRGGIPEIGGDAIMLVDDPHDRAGWIAATRGVIASDQARGELTAMALRRAAEFSWTRAAEATSEVYARLMSGPA
jgi:glycosyltransferase involved in cell wall biosynthesis